ncbi:MAG: hypothetical protein HQK59_07570 [Deltaproteobacteria bacterium]|nr:hypothetical protein [Deltaproteobacteria bacterium]
MPDEWIKKPIEYDNEVKGADLSMMMDQDIYYTLLPIIQTFAQDNHLKIIVQEGSCGMVAGMLASKTIDMGGYCCPPSKDDRLPGLQFYTMGIVSKAFFVNPDNPIDNLTSAQLRDIYAGKLFRWSELKAQTGKPGPGLAIKAVARLHCPKNPGHWRLLHNSGKKFSPYVSEVGSIPDMIAQVAAAKGAIGWEVMTMVEKNKNMGKVKPIKIDGYAPTDSKALAALKYPFYRTYNLTIWTGKGVENKNARNLVSYMIKEFEKLNPDGFGFVSVSRLKKAGWKFKGNELIGEPTPGHNGQM